MNKIKKEELDELLDFERFFDRANQVLGKLTSEFEFKKSELLGQIDRKYSEREEFKKKLSKIYGEDISINISTGDIITKTSS